MFEVGVACGSHFQPYFHDSGGIINNGTVSGVEKFFRKFPSVFEFFVKFQKSQLVFQIFVKNQTFPFS